jgi:YHS domain-containing protein
MKSRMLIGVAFAGWLAAQGSADDPPLPGAKLTLMPSEPLTELRIPGKKAGGAGSPEGKGVEQVRPAILNLKPAGDPIYLVDEQGQDTTQQQWRTYRRPKVDRFSKDGDGIALQGYDLLSYLEKRPEKGKREFSAEHGDVTWLFASEDHRTTFRRDPERYLPAYGGFCAYSVGRGYPATADPRVYSLERGKLYLFFDRAVQTVWEQDQGSILKADHNWPTLHR